MNKLKNMALIAMGGASVLAYQKYNKPVKCAMEKAFKHTKTKANETLEDMM